MTREEVLKEFVRWTNWPETPRHETTFWHSTDAMAEEIVRLRSILAALRENP